MGRSRFKRGELFPALVPITLVRVSRAKRVDEYGDPVDADIPEVVKVFGVSVAGHEPVTGARPEKVEYDLRVYAPSELGISHRDRVVWAGATYEVVGPPSNYDANPWWAPHLVVCNANHVRG